MAGQGLVPNSPNLSGAPRINSTNVVSAVPVITAGSYTSGLQLGSIMTLTDVIRPEAITAFGTSELVEVTVLDGSKQDSAIDIWLFNQSPTLTSTDHTAFALTAANLATQCIGVVSVGGSYSDASAVSVSSTTNLNKPVKILFSSTTPTTVYAVAVCRGTPTYTSTSALKFLFSFFLD